MENIKKAFETIANEASVDISSEIINELAISLKNRLVGEIEKLDAQIKSLTARRNNLESQTEFMESIRLSNANKSIS